MRVLIADDNFAFRQAMQLALSEWGYEVVEAADGLEAWQLLRQEDGPRLALLDWVMPGMDGLQICREVRAAGPREAPYLILLTARQAQEDVIAGLEGGADEYLTKPIDPLELRARVRAGSRIVQLQRSLAGRVRELEEALAKVHHLQGLLPICSWCKKIRDDHNYWQQVDEYISAHADVQFTHGICPDCVEKVIKPELERLAAGQSQASR